MSEVCHDPVGVWNRRNRRNGHHPLTVTTIDQFIVLQWSWAVCISAWVAAHAQLSRCEPTNLPLCPAMKINFEIEGDWGRFMEIYGDQGRLVGENLDSWACSATYVDMHTAQDHCKTMHWSIVVTVNGWSLLLLLDFCIGRNVISMLKFYYEMSRIHH